MEPVVATATATGAEVDDPGRSGEGMGPHRRGTVSLVLRGGGWNLLGQMAPVLVGVLLTPYVVHTLGIARYGLFALATGVTTFLSSFDGGLRPSAQRYLSLYAGQRDDARITRLVSTLTLLVTGLGAVLFGVLWFLSPVILGLFRAPAALRGDGIFLLRTLAITAGLGLVAGVFTALLNAHQRYALTNTTRVCLQLLYAGGVVIALSGGAGLRGIALVLLVQSALSALVLIPSACTHLHRRHLGLLPRRELAGFLRFSGRVQLTAVAGLINLEADTLIVGAFSAISAVGFYNVGAQFAAQLRTVPTNALGPVHTTLARAYGEQGDRAARAEFATLQRYWVIASTGWMSVGMVASFFGVLAWMGDGYQLSAVVASVLLLGHLINMWTGVLTLWLGTIGRPEIEARYGVVGMLLNIVLTVALALPFGVLGVAVATTLAQGLGTAYLQWIVRRRVPGKLRSFTSDIPIRATLCGLLLTAATELVARPVCPHGAPGLLTAGAAAVPGLALYALLAVGPGQVREWVRRRASLSPAAVTGSADQRSAGTAGA